MDYDQFLREQLNWIERLGDKFSGLDERLDYLNRTMLRMERLFGGQIPPIPSSEIAPVTVPALFYGKASGGSKNRLVDHGQSWDPNMWEDDEVAIIDGAGKGQIRAIASNTTDSIVPDTNFAIDPDNTSIYIIRRRRVSGTVAISEGTVTVESGIVTVSGIIDVDIKAQTLGAIDVALDVAHITGQIPISIDVGDITGEIPISINVAHITGNIPIDINAQSMVGNLVVDINAQSMIGNLVVDINAQSMVGNLTVDISAQSMVGNLIVDINAQSMVGNLVVDINAQSMIGNLVIDIEAQSVAVNIGAEWAALQGNDKHEQVTGTNKARGEHVTADYVIPEGKTFYLTHLAGSIFGLSDDDADAPQIFYGWIYISPGDKYPFRFGGNGGFTETLGMPIVIEEEAHLYMDFFNASGHVCVLACSFGGYEL